MAEVQFYGRKVSLKEQTIDFPELGVVEEGIADFHLRQQPRRGCPLLIHLQRLMWLPL